MTEATKDTGAPAEPEQTQPEKPMPTHVVAALARVMEELPGIGKTDHSEQGYNYRGIESITRHAQQLFGRYGVVFVPRVMERKTVELTINNRPWTEEQLTVVYRIYGPGGSEDFIEVGPLLGLGRDNSDKGANKAMTQAFKYALLQVLCVGDGNDDPDKGTANVADEKRAPVDPHKQARIDIGARIRALSPAAREEVRKFCDEHEPPIPRVAAQFTDEQLEAVESFLDRKALAEENGDDAGDDAAAPAQAPSDAEATDTPATSETPAGEPTAAQVDEVIERVKEMSITTVKAELASRNVKVARNVSDDGARQALANKLIEELTQPTLG